MIIIIMNDTIDGISSLYQWRANTETEMQEKWQS